MRTDPLNFPIFVLVTSIAVLGSALSITLDYHIPVFFCSSRQAACHFVQAYLLGAHARWKA